jgi:hypothetical protein
LIDRNAGGCSPDRVLTVPLTLIEIGASSLRGSALGLMPPPEANEEVATLAQLGARDPGNEREDERCGQSAGGQPPLPSSVPHPLCPSLAAGLVRYSRLARRDVEPDGGTITPSALPTHSYSSAAPILSVGAAALGQHRLNWVGIRQPPCHATPHMVVRSRPPASGNSGPNSERANIGAALSAFSDTLSAQAQAFSWIPPDFP